MQTNKQLFRRNLTKQNVFIVTKISQEIDIEIEIEINTLLIVQVFVISPVPHSTPLYDLLQVQFGFSKFGSSDIHCT